MCRGLFSENNPVVILVSDHFGWSLAGRCGEQCRIQILRQKEGGGGGRAGLQDPEIRRGTDATKFFSALQASVWSKNKGGGGVLPPVLLI